MTANVFDEDRRACLEAGMNDFVAKPIDVDTMFKTLAKWLPKQSPANPVDTSQG
jgi:CheY-like chemotaxis protein